MSGKSTRVRISRLNGPQGGGPKKAGLAPLTNIPSSVVRYLRMRGVTTIAGTPTAGTCVTKVVDGNTLSTPFTTQPELYALKGCTKINGNLIISGFVGQPDFSVFSCLKEITGDFSIYDNLELTTISGFSSLLSIGGYFNIYNNSKLTTISSFSSLLSVGGNFNIGVNIKLTTISSFSSLATIGGNFNITYNGVAVTGSVSPNYITTTISSTFEALRTTTPKGISGTTTISGADGTHQTYITSAALAKITAASTTTPITSEFLVTTL